MGSVVLRTGHWEWQRHALSFCYPGRGAQSLFCHSQWPVLSTTLPMHVLDNHLTFLAPVDTTTETASFHFMYYDAKTKKALDYFQEQMVDCRYGNFDFSVETNFSGPICREKSSCEGPRHLLVEQEVLRPPPAFPLAGGQGLHMSQIIKILLDPYSSDSFYS